MAISQQTKEKALIRQVKTDPCVSIIFPFEPKMIVRSKLEYQLKRIAEKTKKTLQEQYPAFMADLLMKKINTLLSGLDYTTHKKTVALFVAPGTQKLHYLDMAVQEKLILNQAFAFRDVVLAKQSIPSYLFLVLAKDRAQLFLGKGNRITPLVMNNSAQLLPEKNDISERVSNFSDPDHRKEVELKKFIRHIDDGLNLVLHAYPLPLFLACTTKTKGYFMQATKNPERVVDYIPGNYEDASPAELVKLIQPYLEDWQKVKEKELMLQLENARNAGKCSYGIEDVYKAARRKKGKLLIVEKNFQVSAFMKNGLLNPEMNAAPSNTAYINDAVDEVIEKVLDQGGDVSMVREGLLEKFGRIALIRYY